MVEKLEAAIETNAPAMSEIAILADSYLKVAGMIDEFYLKKNMNVSDDRRRFAGEVQIHIESLAAILKRVKGPVHTDIYNGLSYPIVELSNLEGEWIADGIATTRDVIRVAEIVLDTITLATASFDAQGGRHRGLRKKIVAAFA